MMTYTATPHLITELLGRVKQHVYKDSPYIRDGALTDIDSSNEYALECLLVTLQSAHDAFYDTVKQRQEEHKENV